MLCHKCGEAMYYAPFGQRWCHMNLRTDCPVQHPRHVATITTWTNL